MCSLHPNILTNPIPILLIVNVPTAEAPSVRERLKEHRKSDSEVRGYSDDGKLKIMKYISFDVKYIRFHKIIFILFNKICYRKELRSFQSAAPTRILIGQSTMYLMVPSMMYAAATLMELRAHLDHVNEEKLTGRQNKSAMIEVNAFV